MAGTGSVRRGAGGKLHGGGHGQERGIVMGLTVAGFAGGDADYVQAILACIAEIFKL
jgi:hypothetical protein